MRRTRQAVTINIEMGVGLDYGFLLTDRNKHRKVTARSLGEPLRFLVVNVTPSMMILSMLVQCKGVEDQAAIKETVVSLTRLGYPELIVRSDNEPAMRSFRVRVELKERFGVRASNRASSTNI